MATKFVLKLAITRLIWERYLQDPCAYQGEIMREEYIRLVTMSNISCQSYSRLGWGQNLSSLTYHLTLRSTQRILRPHYKLHSSYVFHSMTNRCYDNQVGIKAASSAYIPKSQKLRISKVRSICMPCCCLTKLSPMIHLLAYFSLQSHQQLVNSIINTANSYEAIQPPWQ